MRRRSRELGVLDYFLTGNRNLSIAASSRIEGIGRPRVEASFIASVIDRMMRVPDAASVATVHWLETIIGRKCGASTGANLWGALKLAQEMIAQGRKGSIVTLICDPGERYLATYFDAGWIADEKLDIASHIEALEAFARRR